MPQSRGRRRPKKKPTRPSRPGAGRDQLPGELAGMEPWLRAMALADEAEARGDAEGALEVMDVFATGPDGRLFWGPWRVDRLLQIAMFGPLLPAWVTSRWICEQALQSLDADLRGPRRRALDSAVALHGGCEALPGVDEADAAARVMDHDWVFRQLLLFDLGGLESFVRRTA